MKISIGKLVIATSIFFVSLAGAEQVVGDQLAEQLLEKGVSVEKTEQLFKRHRKMVKNSDVVVIVDMNQHSSKDRMHIINKRTQKIISIKVSHGAGSDMDNDGFAEGFSGLGTCCRFGTMLGDYIIGPKRLSYKTGSALLLRGLNKANQSALEKGVVMAPATYVTEKHVGRSWGNFDISKENYEKYSSLLNGALMHVTAKANQ